MSANSVAKVLGRLMNLCGTVRRGMVLLARAQPSDDGLTRPCFDDVATFDVADVSTLLRASAGLARRGPLE